MTLPDPVDLLAALREAGVDFVVIGGVAVAAQGHIRATKDLDIVPASDAENLDRLGGWLTRNAWLASTGERLRERHRRALHLGRGLMVTSDLGSLDVVRNLRGVPTWQALSAGATEIDIGGVTVRVAGVDDLIAMKRAAGRPQDLADIAALEALSEL